MNYCIFLPLFAFIVNLVFLVFIFSKNRQDPINKAFLQFSFLVCFWLFAEIIIWGKGDYLICLVFTKLASISWLASGFLFLNFIYAVMERKRDWLLETFRVPAIIFIFISLSTDLIIHDIVSAFWGYRVEGGLLYNFTIVYCVALPFLAGITLLFRHGMKNGFIPIYKYIFCGSLLLLVFGFTTDFIIPVLLGKVDFISLAPIFTVVLCVFLFFGIYFHGFMISIPAVAKDLFYNITDAILIFDNYGKLKIMNKAAEELFGKKINNKDDFSVSLGDFDYEKPYHEHVVYLKHNRQEFLLNSSAIKHNKQSRGRLFILRDLTSRKSRVNQIIKQQKLESLGVLAGGIAHDFNNALAGILNSITLAKEIINDDKAVEVLSRAQSVTENARNLSHQFITFSKGGKPVKTILDIESVIKEGVGFALSGSDVKYELTTKDDLWSVLGDKSQLDQVFSNLTINSIEAMKTGGKIRIFLENYRVKKNTEHLKKGKYLKIQFSDNGIGIPKKNLNRLFDPYFTTKETGSGLGLFSAYSIIKHHGGNIQVDSSLGTGTIFTIFLPASQKKVQKEEEEFADGSLNEVRILLLDDEEIIYETTGELLKGFGCEVDFAREGEEAIQKYFKAYQKQQPYDIVIMDLTIQGGMGGQEAIKKILEFDPGVKAIISSGYTTNAVMADYQDYGFSGVIVKPYKIEKLVGLITQILQNND
ncbi:MAG: ATP-binding protein [Myxococcota bacterium]